VKKYYDYYVNRRNTPHLDLYTKLIGMFYFWNGMNFILGSAYALSIGQKKLAVSGLVLGILMCSLIKDKTTDKRKNQRDLKAVIGDGIIYAICALGISYVLSFWLLLLVYILEMIYVAWVIFIYFKQQNGQRSRKQRRKKECLEKRSTIEIRFIFCTKFVMCITLSDTKAVFMRVEGTERFM